MRVVSEIPISDGVAYKINHHLKGYKTNPSFSNNEVWVKIILVGVVFFELKMIHYRQKCDLVKF